MRHTVPWEKLPARPLLARQTLAFVAAAALVAYLALRGGGYDIVIRQQVGLILWALLAVGFATGVLPRTRPSRALLIPAIAAAALVAWMALGLIWTESSERTTAELARVVGYLGMMTLALAALDRGTLRAAAAGLSVAVAGITALAFASRLFPGLIPSANDLPESLGIDRLLYPLDYWNAVGAWGAMAIAICLAWSAHARLPLTRALSLAAVPIAAATVYVTYSRGGVIGAGVAVAAVLVLSRNRWTVLVHSAVAALGAAAVVISIEQHEQIAEATGGAGGGLVAVVVLLAGLSCAAAAVWSAAIGTDRLRLPAAAQRYSRPGVWALLAAIVLIAAHGPISRGWDEFKTEDRVTNESQRLLSAGGNRNNLWSSALSAFEAHPVGGTGPGTFEFWWSRDARDPEYVRNAHSLYLETLAETGLPGLLAVIALLGGSLGVALWAGRRIERSEEAAASLAMCSAFCVFLVSAGIDWMWQETAVSAVALVGIAIAMAASSAPQGARAPLDRAATRSFRAAIVVAAVVAAGLQIPGIVATERVRDSEAAARDGDLDRSRQLAEDAVDAEPWAATPYQQLALVEEAQGDLDAAQADIESAIEREKTNWRYPLILARIQAARGHSAAARQTLRRGRELRPLSPAYRGGTALLRSVSSR